MPAVGARLSVLALDFVLTARHVSPAHTLDALDDDALGDTRIAGRDQIPDAVAPTPHDEETIARLQHGPHAVAGDGDAADEAATTPCYFLVFQKMSAISSIFSSSCVPTATSLVCLASPASFVAFQKSSCSCGNSSRCGGLK